MILIFFFENEWTKLQFTKFWILIQFWRSWTHLGFSFKRIAAVANRGRFDRSTSFLDFFHSETNTHTALIILSGPWPALPLKAKKTCKQIKSVSKKTLDALWGERTKGLWCSSFFFSLFQNKMIRSFWFLPLIRAVFFSVFLFLNFYATTLKILIVPGKCFTFWNSSRKSWCKFCTKLTIFVFNLKILWIWRFCHASHIGLKLNNLFITLQM